MWGNRQYTIHSAQNTYVPYTVSKEVRSATGGGDLVWQGHCSFKEPPREVKIGTKTGMSEGALGISRGRQLQAEGTASAKTLNQKRAWGV